MQGEVVGLVHDQNGATPLLDSIGALSGAGGRRGGRRGSPADEAFPSIVNPPKFFVPSREFLLSLSDPPTPDNPIKIPQLGISGSGLKKAELEYYDLKGQTAVQISDVIPGFPADVGGLKQGDVIVKMNGQPLERGDDPDEAYYIMTRKVQQMKVGQTVNFTVVRKGQPNAEITVALKERPLQANKAKRYFAEDLGFAVREIVFDDTYALRIPADTKGVLVALIKAQSAAYNHLATGDLVTRLNAVTIESLDQFKTTYEAFRKDHPHEAVVMEVLRGPNTQIIRIEPPQ
jgi:serine protease Do